MKTAGPLQSLPIPTWKWEDISMDFIVGLPRTAKGFDSTWVIIDRLTKIAHFLPVKTYYPVITYAQIYIARILSLHGIPKTIVGPGTAICIQVLGRATQVLGYQVAPQFSISYSNKWTN
jgi:hypothetical protein